MTPSFDQSDSNQQRLSDLLVDRALGELADTDEAELNNLLASGVPDAEQDAIDRAAVAVELSLLGSAGEAMPKSLQVRLKRDADQFFERAKSTRSLTENPVREKRHLGRRLFIGGLIAAAACIAFALLTPLNPWAKIDPAKDRLALLSVPDSTVAKWTAGPDPIGQNIGGDVVWNQSRQTGYLRFTGLPKNDPSQSQYQLWIFDENQDARYPINGGVFNVAGVGGDVVIPIKPTLHVTHAMMFAISVEKPGGVVVSDRKHLPAIAKVS